MLLWPRQNMELRVSTRSQVSIWHLQSRSLEVHHQRQVSFLPTSFLRWVMVPHLLLALQVVWWSMVEGSSRPLFAQPVNRDARVSDYLEHSSSVVWSPPFVHQAFPEDGSVAQLFTMVHPVSVKDSSLDTIRSSPTFFGVFTVKSDFLHPSAPLGNTSLALLDCVLPWNIIWKFPPL